MLRLEEVCAMLIKVAISNFKSFDQMAELSMISSSKIRMHADHKAKIKQTPILRNSVIYGANAAGKSNFVEFFNFFKWTVQNGLPLEATNMFCRNSEDNATRKSEFEIQFTVEDKFYAYGFTAILKERIILEEWLYELKQNGGAKVLFEKEKGKRPVLGSGLNVSEFEKNKFNVYAEDFDDTHDILFLTEMNRNKKYDSNSKLSFFTSVYGWIANNIVILSPKSKLVNFEQYYDGGSLKKINELLKSFDTGIREVNIKEIDFDELGSLLPESVFQEVIADIRINLAKSDEVHLSMRSDDSFFNIVAEKNSEPKVYMLCLKHGKSIYDFDFKDESDGTRRIFDLMDMLLSKKKDVLYVVDELERSLHPKLTFHFLELFMETHKGDRAQLVFTTHEDTIMDLDLFRRDEIWFIERDAANSSNIYSLDRFKERYDKKLSKAYLEGRYGAIPVFSTFSFEEGY